MKIKLIPAKKLDYDPFDEDCCGAHKGEYVEVTCANDIQVVVEEIRSGLGPSYNIYVKHEGQTIKVFGTFVDDDGEFCLWIAKKSPQRGGPTL
jgi:hypothetical protein